MQISQNPEPLVSICIPVYNAGNTIRKTLSSIINQKYKNLEIIIVDNNSTDNSVQLIRSFHDPRIKVIQHEVHFPIGEHNWNRCFSYACGEYLAIFHADDVYLPDMVSRQIETFRQYPSICGVFTQGDIIDENDEKIGEFQLPPEIKSGIPCIYKDIFFAALDYADFLPCPSAMLRRDAYSKLAPFMYDQFRSASDFDMWLRASKYSPVVILNEKLMNYRVSRTQGTNVLNRLRTHESDFFRVMDYHIKEYLQTDEIPAQKMNGYDLLRFGDLLIRTRNSFSKRDWKEFKTLLKEISWLKCAGIILRNPMLLYSKYKLFKYFRTFKVN
jgi:glycosyltransferase involved in cell wall biosynthesis